MIVVTQPRRVAAVTVAQRVAIERGVEIGQEVGYTVRFTDCSSPATKLKYVTDGVLLRELLVDPLLSQYSVIILDEAHERTVNTDVLFGLLKRTLRRRPALRVLVTSATLNVAKFSAFYDDCPVMQIPGRCYSVEEIYRPPPNAVTRSGAVEPLEANNPMHYIRRAVQCVMEIHTELPPGDVLVFLSGQDEIDECIEQIKERVQQLYDENEALFDKIMSILPLPLYAALPPEKQVRVFRRAPPNTRKVIVATNIAETSVTINGIVYVVDSGFHKQKNFNAKTGMESLDVCTVSRVAAEQRKGRAGRTQAGKVYRLYSREQFLLMSATQVPEIQRTNLGLVCLFLKCSGVSDVLSFDLLDRPERAALVEALKQLYFLDALDEKGALTAKGRRMSAFPVQPELARVLVEAAELGCVREVLLVAAALSVDRLVQSSGGSGGGGGSGGSGGGVEARLRDLYAAAAAAYGASGDHMLLLFIMEQFMQRRGGERRAFCTDHGLNERGLREAADICKQLGELLEKQRVDIRQSHAPALVRALCSGYFLKTAKRSAASPHAFLLQNRGAHQLYIHPSSSLFRRGGGGSDAAAAAAAAVEADARSSDKIWVLFQSVVFTSRPFMRTVSYIKWQWIEKNYERLMQFATDEQLLDDGNQGGAEGETAVSAAAAAAERAKERRNDDDKINQARKRYLERKQQKSKKKRKK